MKILYGIVVILMFILGFAALCYGLFLVWQPLAWIMSGILLIGVGGLLNQSYTGKERG